MKIISKTISSSNLFRNFYVNRTNFLNAPYNAVLLTNGFKGNIGSALKVSINASIKAAIGEHLERTTLYMHRPKKPFFWGYNLVKNDICKVPVERVTLKIELLDKKQLPEDYFNDSSGVASHQNSNLVLKSAFLEYIERQSLIYNWLTATSGVRIDIDSINDHHINKLIKNTYNFVDILHIVNISIHNSIYVILCIGYSEEYVSVAIAADWDLNHAISSSLQEFLQTFGNKINKSYLDDRAYNYQQTSKNKKKIDENDPHLYGTIFMDNYGNKDSLIKAFNYLIESPKVSYSNLLKDVPDLSQNITTSISQVGKDLGLNIICCFIPSFVQGTNIKIVKVLSTNGYPHMMTDRLNPYIYQIPNLQNSAFPNKYKPIPFP